MKRHTKAGANLFFLEFIIVLFFFLIVSTICIQVFVHAHLVTEKAEAISHAQTLASSIAEVLEGTDGSAEALGQFFPDAVLEEDRLTFSFDQDFAACPPEDAFYTVTAKLESDDRRKGAVITAADRNQETFFELPVSFYRPLTRQEVLP